LATEVPSALTGLVDVGLTRHRFGRGEESVPVVAPVGILRLVDDNAPEVGSGVLDRRPSGLGGGESGLDDVFGHLV